MIKKTKISYARIVNCEFANVLDFPDSSSPTICQLSSGDKVKIIAKERKYYKIQVSYSVTGYLDKQFVKVE